MKYIRLLLFFYLALLSISCDADSDLNQKFVDNLMNHFFPNNNNSGIISYKTGDFNGDGLQDIVVLFKPTKIPDKHTNMHILTPWNYNNSEVLHRSLVIFNNPGKTWEFNKTHVFLLLDKTGVLETPSFQLLISKFNSKTYNSHASYLPVKTKSDLIILPTESGIDTYIYWNKNTYQLFEPEEIP